eukprot:SAG11_NODE_5092_length_1666_cov_2.855775_1_plen_76_part_00
MFEGVMSFKKFRFMKENLVFEEYRSGERGYRENDPFAKVRKFADVTGMQVRLVYYAGTLLTGDESMTLWKSYYPG